METDAVFQGTFTGNIQDLTVRAHILGHTGESVQSSAVPLEISLSIDGQQLLNQAALTIPVDGRPQSAFRLVDFRVTDLGCAREVRDTNGEVIDVVTGGFATEDGYGSAQHNISLKLAYAGAVADNRVDHILWVWDTQELASGIQFNGAGSVPASTTIQSATPASCS